MLLLPGESPPLDKKKEPASRIRKSMVAFEFWIQLSLRQDLLLPIMVLVGFMHLQLEVL